MNLPNKITLARIMLVPVVMFFLLTLHEWPALFFFLLAALTDGLDGYVARKNRLVTNMGKFLDPLADKLLISAVLIALVQLQRLDAWVATVIICREFAVTGLRLVGAADGRVIAASRMGKLKTVSQIIAISLLIVDNFPFSRWGLPMADVAVGLAVLLTVVSGIEYFLKNWSVLQKVG
ncbi:MAG: CDP-diacylglycerol--glycerol-3-phosphate 3-phosphatidyltransferase [Bacillaceae bacterium G1]|nr:CDP-diacylglycerol--glycerol-3-phosphate 3-phosphatidyltransferase [Bacillota bacterium]OJF17633.1 MAG: CDP-diacylglycerol--glycerol-3-phosphate 3-phosphatidyltransferase [Bacillaceae bacterium G1]